MVFEIVAHRGDTSSYPENSLAAFEGAAELGADAFELDVRLTADQVPVVYHFLPGRRHHRQRHSFRMDV